MNYKVNEILSFFKTHPNYPFDQYYSDYDEYCAARLMALKLVKAYIPKLEIDDWQFVSNYYDARRQDQAIFYSLISCINHKKEQVLFFAITDNRENISEIAEITLNVERDDFYGNKWNDDAPIDEWYSIFQITINLPKLVSFQKLDNVLKMYFQNKLSFDELWNMQEQFTNDSM